MKNKKDIILTEIIIALYGSNKIISDYLRGEKYSDLVKIDKSFGHLFDQEIQTELFNIESSINKIKSILKNKINDGK